MRVREAIKAMNKVHILNGSETMVVLLLRPSQFQKEVVSGEDSSANHIVEAFMTCGGVHGICGAVDFTTMA